jgi:protein dithiol oxidoreductase (disulfide-forming)
MKRSAALAFTLILATLLTACSKNTPSSVAVTDSNASASAASVEFSSSASSTANTVAETSEPIPEQLSETAGSPAATASTTNALSLKMTEPKPEPASRWQEGVHYTRLAPVQPTSVAPGQIEVTEVFWYGCPHCNALDPYLESWRRNGKPSYVSFVRVPVMWSPGHKLHARVFYTAELLGKLDALHTVIFREMQVNGNPMTSTAQVEQFFVRNGVSQADFQKAFSSFAVESSLARAETLGLRYKVESVPLIIINGKYVSDIGKAGGPQELLALINDLAAREKAN